MAVAHGLQISAKLLWGLPMLAAACALGACATTAPATQATVPAKPVAVPAASAATLPGYRRVVRNGQTLYCINEIPTGSRMMEETCLTQAQMDSEREKARNFTEGVQGIATLPPTPNQH
jgi:hypothetical protein